MILLTNDLYFHISIQNSGRNYGYPEYEGPCLHGTSHRCQLPGNKNMLEPFHWYAHRKTKEGGCVSGAAIVPNNLGWPSQYKFLFADFIFFEIYNIVEDPDSYCRSCRPPTSGYTNETFYRVTSDNDRDIGSITDIFFAPYKVCVIVFYKQSTVTVPFYSLIHDNHIPITHLFFLWQF